MNKPIYALILAVVMILGVAALAVGAGEEDALKQAILDYLAKTGADPKSMDPHQTALVDLNGDGHEDALVLLQNPMYFCGTGGCTLLVFKGTKSGFEFVSRSTLIRGPVLVSDTQTHDWRDLVVEVSGGGMEPKRVALKYTGKKYPLNPSTLPALPKDKQTEGTKVFEDKSWLRGASDLTALWSPALNPHPAFGWGVAINV